MPNELRPYFLFALESYDGTVASTVTAGGVIIAIEDPVYVGRLDVGAAEVTDHSELAAPAPIAANLYRELQQIGTAPGAEVTREYEELFNLITEPALRISRRTKVVFKRSARYTSFVRDTDRYERLLREFVDESAC